MNDKIALDIYEHTEYQHNMDKAGIVRDILLVLTPWLILGGIGEWLGDETTLGAVFIMLGYVLGVVLATIVLKRRGSGWREIGLARPDSWRKTILLGLGAFVVTTLAYLAIQMIVQNLPGLEIAPADKSSHNPIYGNLPLLILYLVAAWTTIGFGEEMLFRGSCNKYIVGVDGCHGSSLGKWYCQSSLYRPPQLSRSYRQMELKQYQHQRHRHHYQRWPCP